MLAALGSSDVSPPRAPAVPVPARVALQPTGPRFQLKHLVLLLLVFQNAVTTMLVQRTVRCPADVDKCAQGSRMFVAALSSSHAWQ